MLAMNAYDYNRLLALNRLADSSPLLTKVIVAFYLNPLKTILLVAFLWWAWFNNEGHVRHRQDRERIVACLVGSFLCIAGVRLLAILLPFRVRPILNPDLVLHFPKDVGGYIATWSSS